MLDALLGMVLPRSCLACGAPRVYPLCRACRVVFPWNSAPCQICAAPDRAPLCSRCRAARPHYETARAVASYRGVARDMVMRFKLGGERRAAWSLAMPMAALAQPADVLTFVPGTRAAVNARGFNPAELLARAVAKQIGLESLALLRKTRVTKDSAGLGRVERRLNLANAFAAKPVIPRRVLLIDDILTTGATAEACSQVLRIAGAEEVHVLTFARTP